MENIWMVAFRKSPFSGKENFNAPKQYMLRRCNSLEEKLKRIKH